MIRGEDRHVDIDQYAHKACSCGWDAATDEDVDAVWAHHVARLQEQVDNQN